ncbi:MAG TPA: hypothetical protein VMD02_06965 [Candidatus Omnitrophota bacterium]|nr:hypothetical protein [Candidatus Omnitrophota bacterium]
MKKSIIALLLLALTVTAASAELLVTANPIGQGKWALSGVGMQDSNVMNTSGYSMTSFGGYVGYGMTDKLDLFLNAGMANVGGLPSVGGIQAASATTSVGILGKYTVISEGANMPVSIAIGAGYRALSTKTTMPAFIGGSFVGVDSTTSGSQIMGGVGISKIIVPFVPYCGILYRSTSSGGTSISTQMDLTLGTAVAWSMQGAVLVEYTLQSITPNGGSGYTSGQIGASVAYTI